MDWASEAKRLAAGAARARQAGDVVACLVLSIKAAECNAIAKALAEADGHLQAMEARRADPR